MKRTALIAVVITLIAAGAAAQKARSKAEGKKESIVITDEYRQLQDIYPKTYWSNWTDSTQGEPYLRGEPFGRTYIPPQNEQIQYDSAPQMNNYKNSPFD